MRFLCKHIVVLLCQVAYDWNRFLGAPSSGNLKSYLSEVTGVDAPSLISFLPDGKQLRDENIRQLADSQDDVSFNAVASLRRRC